MLEARTPRLTSFMRAGTTRFFGHVVSPEDPGRRFMVDILVDDCRVATVPADRFDPSLADAGIGDGCHAFLCDLDADLLDRARTVVARISNLDTPVGEPIDIEQDRAEPAMAERRMAGRVEWQGGLRLAGLARERAPPAAPPVLRIEVDDAPLLSVKPRRWQSRSVLREEVDQIPFDLTLPDRFADGQPHRIRVLDEAGIDLEGSPLTVLAETAAPTPNVEADAVLFRAVEHWLPGKAPASTGVTLPGVRIVLIGEDGADASVESLDGEATPWSLVAIPADADGGFDPDALRSAAHTDLREERIAVFARAGIRFRPGGLARLIAPFTHTDTGLSYADVLIDLGNDHVYPGLWSAFDRVRAQEQAYMSTVFAMELARVDSIVSDRARSLFAVALTAAATGKVAHVPGPVAVVQKPDPAAEAARQVQDLDRLGIVADTITTALLPTVRIRPSPQTRFAVAVVVHGGHEDALRTLQEHVVEGQAHAKPGQDISFHAAPRSTARALNEAAREAEGGDALLFVHGDLQGLSPDVIAELVGRLHDPDVAAAGALVETADGMIARSGWTCGPGLTLVDRGAGWPAAHPGFADHLRAAHRVLAVDASALLVRRRAFEAAGGFDAINFPTALFAEDLCLRLQATGGAIVLTPHARLRGHLPPFRAFQDGPPADAALIRSRGAFRNRWASALIEDAFYNPLLNRIGPPFSALRVDGAIPAAREVLAPAPWPGLDMPGTAQPARDSSRAIRR
jgi:hypothetical protein